MRAEVSCLFFLREVIVVRASVRASCLFFLRDVIGVRASVRVGLVIGLSVIARPTDLSGYSLHLLPTSSERSSLRELVYLRCRFR